jgi:hypothetical protein
MSLTLIATLAIGSIKLVSQDQWYAQSGRFEHVAVTERFREKLKEAISKGYVGLRANGSSAWLQRADSMAFSEYEKKLDDLIADEKMIVVCSFLFAGQRFRSSPRCGAHSSADSSASRWFLGRSKPMKPKDAIR